MMHSFDFSGYLLYFVFTSCQCVFLEGHIIVFHHKKHGSGFYEALNPRSSHDESRDLLLRDLLVSRRVDGFIAAATNQWN